MNTPNTTAPSRIELPDDWLPTGWTIYEGMNRQPCLATPGGDVASFYDEKAWDILRQLAEALNRPTSPHQAPVRSDGATSIAQRWSDAEPTASLVTVPWSDLKLVAASLLAQPTQPSLQGDAMREALEAILQHEASSFPGPDGERNRKASWRGVIRKIKKAVAAAPTTPPAPSVDDEVNRILALSDEETFAEFVLHHGDPSAFTEKMRAFVRAHSPVNTAQPAGSALECAEQIAKEAMYYMTASGSRHLNEAKAAEIIQGYFAALTQPVNTGPSAEALSEARAAAFDEAASFVLTRKIKRRDGRVGFVCDKSKPTQTQWGYFHALRELADKACAAPKVGDVERLRSLLENAELLVVQGADIFNSEGSRLLRISCAQRDAALAPGEDGGRVTA